jgi:hypothetical protein
MTIETATPSSAETIAALFDTLVAAVAARVLEQLDLPSAVGKVFEAKLDQLDVNIDARIELAIESFALEQLDGKIDEWAANFLDDRVKEHVSSDEDDLHDQVLEIVQGLNYDVRVHVSS